MPQMNMPMRRFKLTLVVFVVVACNRTSDNVAESIGTIADFKFMDQDSNWVTRESFNNDVFVVDFFFTRCKTICPVMTVNMNLLYQEFKDLENVKFLSHTIDPDNDTPKVLNEYAGRLGIESSKWHMVTGEKDSIYKLAHDIYKNSVLEDDELEDGFIHSGAFILVDKNGNILKHYDGTNNNEVRQLADHIWKLLAEYDLTEG